MRYALKNCQDCSTPFKPTSGRQSRCQDCRTTEPEKMPTIPTSVKVRPERQPYVDLALKLARKASTVPALAGYVADLLEYVKTHEQGLTPSRLWCLSKLGHGIAVAPA